MMRRAIRRVSRCVIRREIRRVIRRVIRRGIRLGSQRVTRVALVPLRRFSCVALGVGTSMHSSRCSLCSSREVDDVAEHDQCHHQEMCDKLWPHASLPFLEHRGYACLLHRAA
ncbi:MAG: hypothetical protein EXS10_06445 [Phycisphaerales bacterium]|nr:hypothetical protein [Phycisphaerales bacterium]